MGRRRFREAPTTFGSNTMSNVYTKIDNKIKDEIAMFSPFTHSNHALIQGSVSSEIINVLKKAKEWADGYHSSSGTIPFRNGMKFTVDFERYHCLVPKEEHIKPNQQLIALLNSWWENTEPIIRKWMVVRHVATWFNEHANIAATRYYWPCMMQLLPEGSKLQEMHMAGVGTHQKEPVGIANVLPLCRETASVVTSGTLLPERNKGNKCHVKLSVPQTSFWYTDYAQKQHNITSTALVLDF